MIDLSRETVISLMEATRHLPRRRMGKRPNIATVYRWAKRGVHGVVLETIQVGGTKCTSLEALQRYCNRLTSPDEIDIGDSSDAHRRHRKKEIEKAQKACEEAGL